MILGDRECLTVRVMTGEFLFLFQVDNPSLVLRSKIQRSRERHSIWAPSSNDPEKSNTGQLPPVIHPYGEHEDAKNSDLKVSEVYRQRKYDIRFGEHAKFGRFLGHNSFEKEKRGPSFPEDAVQGDEIKRRRNNLESDRDDQKHDASYPIRDEDNLVDLSEALEKPTVNGYESRSDEDTAEEEFHGNHSDREADDVNQNESDLNDSVDEQEVEKRKHWQDSEDNKDADDKEIDDDDDDDDSNNEYDEATVYDEKSHKHYPPSGVRHHDAEEFEQRFQSQIVGPATDTLDGTYADPHFHEHRMYGNVRDSTGGKVVQMQGITATDRMPNSFSANEKQYMGYGSKNLRPQYFSYHDTLLTEPALRRPFVGQESLNKASFPSVEQGSLNEDLFRSLGREPMHGASFPSSAILGFVMHPEVYQPVVAERPILRGTQPASDANTEQYRVSFDGLQKDIVKTPGQPVKFNSNDAEITISRKTNILAMRAKGSRRNQNA